MKPLCALAWLVAFACGVCSAQDLKLKVKVFSAVPPSGAQMESDMNLGSYDLNRDAATGIFTFVVPATAIEKIKTSEKIVSPHRIVVSWPDGREQLFIGLRSPVPPALDFSVYREPIAFDAASIQKIDSLSSDYESTVQKYFLARTFHNHWRFSQKNPTFYLALRSARIWFDAASRLAARPNSSFMMDPDVVTIMKGYEEMAKSDSAFRGRLRKYAGDGYVSGTLSQMAAIEFSSVGTIPELRMQGRLEEARIINMKALSSLEDASDDVRASVRKHQGISVELLKANQRVLE